MAKVLCAWELGGGLGHIQALLSVARALAREGHEPVCAFRNIIEGYPLWSGLPFAVLQAPIWHNKPFPGGGFASFADILAFHGYTDVNDLSAQVHAWQSLLDLVRPDLIVVDHAPTVCLAAWRQIPVVQLGTGFSVPPGDAAGFFPVWDPTITPLAPQQRILDVIRAVQQHRDRPVPERLCEVWQSNGFVRTLPDLDPYRRLRSGPVYGPLEPLPRPRPLPRERSYFAYLAGDFADVQVVLDALTRAGLSGSVYLGGVTPPVREQLRRKGSSVHEQPVPMVEALTGASLLVHHGGIGTTEQALAVGRPQLLLPRFPEQVLTGLALNRLGSTAFVVGRPSLEQLLPLIDRLTQDPQVAHKAEEYAQNLQQHHAQGSLPALVALCRRLLNDAAP